MLTLNWQIIFTFINLIVLFILLKIFLFGRIEKIAQQRQEIIQKSLDEAEDQKKQAEATKTRYEQRLKDAQAEAQQLLQDANNQANKQAQQIVSEAKVSAQRIVETAQETVEQQRKEAIAQVSSSVTSIALMAAAKVAQKNLENEGNEAFVDALLNEAGARHE